jgi:hypothetical protein
MNPPGKKKSKMILLFSAVLVFQCCCCIIPYSWGANFESFTLASPFQQESEIRIPPRESLKADANSDIISSEMGQVNVDNPDLTDTAGETNKPERSDLSYR